MKIKLNLPLQKKTKAIMPVHWAGRPCELDKIKSISKKYNLHVIQDTCHGIESRYKKKHLVNFGDVCTYSMHPLKNLNVWGDGGFIVTQKEKLAKKLSLIRNHGLKNRNTCEVFGYNSRLDTIQACVANHLLKKIYFITNNRIKNAEYLDKKLMSNKNIILKPKQKNTKDVYHLYEIRVKKINLRNDLIKFLNKNKIDAKIHYPVPMHLQPAAKEYGYKKGDFPICEEISDTTISIPVHEFITEKQMNFVIKKIKKFFNEN